MRKKQEILDIQKAVQLSVEFGDTDPVKAQEAVSKAQQAAQAREARNKAYLAHIEREDSKFRTIAVRIGSEQVKALYKLVGIA